jgi:phosphoribosylglycinamide formyltransferase-1
MKQTNMAIFASGSGSNCENIIRYFRNSPLVNVSLVVSNKPDAPVLERAKQLGVPSIVVTKTELNDASVMLKLLKNADFIVLAGFLPLIPEYLIEAFPHRIVNIHPALLPKYGGKGMWGHHVHEAVKASGDTVTGMTVHFVTPVCDAGEIIAQFSVAVSPNDSVEDIAAKEHNLEMEHFPKVLEELILNSTTK